MPVTFKEIELVRAAKKELFSAYMKQAKLSAERVELEKKLEKIDEKLASNEGVAEVHKNAKYRTIKDLLNDKNFIKDIQTEVSKAYKLKKRRALTTAKVNKTSETDRELMRKANRQKKFREIFKANGMKPMTTKELTEAFINANAMPDGKTLAQMWQGLEVPKKAKEMAGAARRDGTKYDPKKISWIASS